MRIALMLGLFLLTGSLVNAGEESSRGTARPFFAKPLLIGAHRGGGDLWPENTLEAYRNASRRWPDVLLEGDVHATADGQVMILHDDTVDRTTDGAGPLSQLTFAQVKALDAGYRFTLDDGATFPYRGKGLTIPTLAEALAALPASRFLIEMKSQPGIAEATIKVLQQASALERVALASVNPVTMNRARALAPTLVACYDFIDGTALLTSLRNGSWSGYKPAADILAVERKMIRDFQIQPAELRAIQTKGIAVLVFTVDKPEEMREFLNVGVASILTDRPDLLAQVIAEKK
jgi:glycerophosphoryl diester phosphodiesterase